MTIQDGTRAHEGRYRVPDLLSEEEFKMYMASTYSIGVEFSSLSDEMKEKVVGVGTLPVSSTVTPRDRELITLREMLGIDNEERLKELESRVMTHAEFKSKYGPTTELDDLLRKQNSE